VTAPELALRLRQAGLRWRPAPGDRFFLPHRDMDNDVFVLSDMTVEVHEFPTGRVIGFNGVTEWALDSVDVEEAVWVPAEHQLRDLLGRLFRRLENDGDQFTVTFSLSGQEEQSRSSSAADAYALALLAVLDHVGAVPQPSGSR
jgi:hypothetical protein